MFNGFGIMVASVVGHSFTLHTLPAPTPIPPTPTPRPLCNHLPLILNNRH